MNRRAFTLVELLVVIAIIGLLSTVAVVSLGSSRLQARNAKRLADMKQYVNAFQLAYDANGNSYASGTGSINAGPAAFYGWSGIAANATVDAFFSPYLPNKPVYPTPNPAIAIAGYMYIGGWGGGTSPYGSVVYPAQPILDWTLEGSTNCGFGLIWDQRAAYTECIYLLRNNM